MPPNNPPTPQDNQSPPVVAQQTAMPDPESTPVTNSPEPLPPAPVPTQEPNKPRNIKLIVILALAFILSTTGAYLLGKHGQKIVYKAPTPPPVSLPPQAIVVKECVPGFGKQYVIPKDIPNGPIYDVHNSKVIAVEYNYKAVDLFLNPDKLSKTVVPFSKTYQIDSFTTSIGELKAGTLEQAQNVPIHLVMYVVPKKEAQKITCNTSGT